MKHLHTFESYLQFAEIEDLIAESEELINEAGISFNLNEAKEALGLDENATEEEIDEACEKAFNELMEDKESIFDDLALNVDEDASNPYASVRASGAKAQAAIDAQTRMMDRLEKQSRELEANQSSRITIKPEHLVRMGVLAAVVGATIGAGVLLYKFIKKRREIKKALSGMEDGPKKDALRKKYKAMSTNEIQQLNQIKMSKARVKGASDAAAGKEANTNQDPVVQSSYLEGYKEGQKKIKEIEAINKMPKEERKEKIKELKNQIEPIKSAKGKIEGVANKLKELKK